MTLNKTVVSLPDTIGKGYKDFWDFKGRYLVCKGSRGSKKSTTAALKLIYTIMKYPLSNALVVRRYETLHRHSTYQQLKWAISRFHVKHLWKLSLSPLQMTYTPTGQQIIFRGLDNVESLTSITVANGVLNLVWVEEAYQIEKEEDFNKLDLSIRGVLPDETMYKQFIITFNPWNSDHWLKKRFFDETPPNALSMTTNYKVNEWLGEDDLQVFENMRKKHPKRYSVEGLGEWGTTQGAIYQNWEIQGFDWNELYVENTYTGDKRFELRFGMDFGFSVDPTAFIACLVNSKEKELYIFDEFYKYGLTNKQIYEELLLKGFAKARIIADNAEPRTINELVILGVKNMLPAKKGQDSVRSGIQRLQDYRMIVHPRCENTIKELANYSWKENRSGQSLNVPNADGFDHLMDALRYATETVNSKTFSFE